MILQYLYSRSRYFFEQKFDGKGDQQRKIATEKKKKKKKRKQLIKKKKLEENKNNRIINFKNIGIYFMSFIYLGIYFSNLNISFLFL